jgi:large subunit ribosomal protein L9
MKVILTEKITGLGGIGDIADVATGYARNYLLPNGRALRFSKENLAAFENKKAELVARHESARAAAEENLPRIQAAKLHLIRSAGDTGRLYGSVSSRDIARLIGELTNIGILSEQVLLGQPIKEIGAWDVKIALHPDVAADVKVYVAQTRDEIDALVAGKSVRKNIKIGSAESDAETSDADATGTAADTENRPNNEPDAESDKESPAPDSGVQ